MEKCCKNCYYSKIDLDVSDGKVRCAWYDWNPYPDSFREMFKKNASFEMDPDDGSECSEFMEDETD